MPDPVRIAYLVSRYPATNHTFILREITTLRSLGFDIQVIAIRGADRPASAMTDVEREEDRLAIRVLPFGFHFFTAHLATLFTNPAGYFRGLALALSLGAHGFRPLVFHFLYFLEAITAGRAAQRAGYRHIHSHFSSTVAVIAARAFGFAFSMTIHGPDEFRSQAFGMRAKVAASEFVAAISHYARSQIMEASDPADWGKIEVCRLGVNPAVFTPAPPSGNDGEFHVIFVGRLAPVKALPILISAAAQLIAEGWNLKVHLVGSGPEEQRLRQLANTLGIRDRIVFEGARNQTEVIELYRRSHVFALASFAEGIPVVLMEAMAMEVPCVATWVNGIPELIHSGESGLLVAPSDAPGLAGAIAALLGNSELRRKFGREGRRQVLEHYDLQRNTVRLAEVFRGPTRPS